MSGPETQEPVPIGEMVKRLREGANLSVEALAKRAGLQPQDIERIEQDLISPALGVLTRICDGLGVRVGHFFSQGPRKHFSLVRASDQKVATRFASKSGADYGYEYIALGAEKRERVMEPFLITITPPSLSRGEQTVLDEATAHGGEEFIHVLEGEIEVQLEDQRYHLSPGDSIYYDASVQHRVIHRGDRPSKVLAVFHFPRAQD